MNNIEHRLGILIGILRKKKLKAGNPAFKQESFILSTSDSPFEGIKFNHRVCSLATLSRLENGKHHHDFELLDFFLKKLGIHYRIRESNHMKELDFLAKISSSFKNHSIDELKIRVSEFNEFCSYNSNDVLIEMDHLAFTFVFSCLSNQPISRKTYDSIMDRIEVFHPIIKNWIISSRYLLKFTHPDFWSIEKPSLLPELIKLCRVELIQLKINHKVIYKENNDKPFLSKDSLAKQLLHEIALLNYTDQIPKGLYAKELNLCIKLASEETIDEKGFSLLFNVLDYFNGIDNPELKLSYFINKISPLLKCEPYPKRITKLLSKRVLILCHGTKTYKPLSNLVDLLVEKNKDKHTLFEQFE